MSSIIVFGGTCFNIKDVASYISSQKHDTCEEIAAAIEDFSKNSAMQNNILYGVQKPPRKVQPSLVCIRETGCFTGLLVETPHFETQIKNFNELNPTIRLRIFERKGVYGCILGIPKDHIEYVINYFNNYYKFDIVEKQSDIPNLENIEYTQFYNELLISNDAIKELSGEERDEFVRIKFTQKK